MKRILILLSVITTIGIITWSCERDDICAAETPTTPLLIIRFYDINDPDNLKQVRQLEVEGLDPDTDLPFSDDPIIVARQNTDSISIPLNFDNEDANQTTRFLLTRDADFADDVTSEDEPNLLTNSNPDIITITYTPEFIYVSRACGYKSIFNLADPGGIMRDNDEDSWILNFDIINQTVDNENAAHIEIFH